KFITVLRHAAQPLSPEPFQLLRIACLGGSASEHEPCDALTSDASRPGTHDRCGRGAAAGRCRAPRRAVAGGKGQTLSADYQTERTAPELELFDRHGCRRSHRFEVRPLPPQAEQVAPQLRGYGYVVVEEQIALVEPRSRKIEVVFPRWREP